MQKKINQFNIFLIVIFLFSAIKLADFGISRQMERGQQAQTMVGTPQFLAPEIVQSGGGGVDGYGAKVDVWSCGMCAGKF